MIPITAGILGGAGAQGRSRGQTVAYTLVYAVGLALVYAVLGLIAGLTGSLFGTISSNPWAYFAFGNLLLLAALAMFDVIPVAAPARLVSWAGRVGVVEAKRNAHPASMGSAARDPVFYAALAVAELEPGAEQAAEDLEVDDQDADPDDGRGQVEQTGIRRRVRRVGHAQPEQDESDRTQEIEIPRREQQRTESQHQAGRQERAKSGRVRR